jgi:NAD(P)-dependent dehydrogenase (short-subunit alcohol dehydrogenase family)
VGIPGDLRDEAFCQQLVAKSVEALGGLDIIVSNAGRQQAHKSILDITTEDFDATMKTNIYAPFWIIKAALPHLQPGSVIIGTTSEQAYDPSADLYDYAQTKAATMNYVKSLAKQLGPKGIRVNGVAPGPIWTPLQVSGGATQEKLRQFGARTPTACRAGIHLRTAGRQQRELRQWTDIRLRRRQRTALAAIFLTQYKRNPSDGGAFKILLIVLSLAAAHTILFISTFRSRLIATCRSGILILLHRTTTRTRGRRFGSDIDRIHRGAIVIGRRFLPSYFFILGFFGFLHSGSF